MRWVEEIGGELGVREKKEKKEEKGLGIGEEKGLGKRRNKGKRRGIRNWGSEGIKGKEGKK
ncbi:hypothetical protein ACPV36_12240 [Photobacterium damselae]|uniref:hypothetical protein n=1 Tax=Photobacterium damselae TaxID=38293 RepID=UPI00406977FB